VGAFRWSRPPLSLRTYVERGLVAVSLDFCSIDTADLTSWLGSGEFGARAFCAGFAWRCSGALPEWLFVSRSAKSFSIPPHLGRRAAVPARGGDLRSHRIVGRLGTKRHIAPATGNALRVCTSAALSIWPPTGAAALSFLELHPHKMRTRLWVFAPAALVRDGSPVCALLHCGERLPWLEPCCDGALD